LGGAPAEDEENFEPLEELVMNIFVGNLPYDADDQVLKETFEPFGAVESARVISDRYSGRSRGFGFVEMNDDTEAQAAIDSLNGKDLQGRALTVNQAKPREPRSPRW
jgi:RNA recognition motif-containing protein